MLQDWRAPRTRALPKVDSTCVLSGGSMAPLSIKHLLASPNAERIENTALTAAGDSSALKGIPLLAHGRMAWSCCSQRRGTELHEEAAGLMCMLRG